MKMLKLGGGCGEYLLLDPKYEKKIAFESLGYFLRTPQGVFFRDFLGRACSQTRFRHSQGFFSSPPLPQAEWPNSGWPTSSAPSH